MYCRLLLTISIALVPIASLAQSSIIYDYYWRDYYGIIPEDAVVGGRDVSGSPIYVGQVYTHNRVLLPASIYQNKSQAITTSGVVIRTDQYVKILCGPKKENFHWVATQSKDLHLQLINDHVIIGGSARGETLYIGRVFEKNQITLGKIFRNGSKDRGIWVPSGNKEINYLSYEVLVYRNTSPDKPKLNSTCDCCPFYFYN